MNKLVLQVAVRSENETYFCASVPGLLVCAFGTSLEETLANTQRVVMEYLKDSAAANDALGATLAPSYSGVSWHIVEVQR